MEQMTDIREQQERLAKLHFDLGATIGSSEEPLHHSMTQLVQRLQQLSVSIEQLHSTND